MGKGRLEAFSDGVLAIIITIMVLELKVPRGDSLADLKPMWPIYLSYVLSYIYIGIYWNNHHHLFQVTRRITGGVMWANLHLLFWLSIIPFVTDWMGENHFARTPVVLYGGVLCMCGVAFWILQSKILSAPGGNKLLADAIGANYKGKISVYLYVAAIGLAFVSRWLACALYVLVALMWLVPDPRIERVFANHDEAAPAPSEA